MIKHEQIEKSVPLLIILTLLVVVWGGLLEIVPLFFQKSTTTPVEGVKPYDAVRLVGRDIYLREGCYNCHSADDSPVPRRNRTLRSLLCCR